MNHRVQNSTSSGNLIGLAFAGPIEARRIKVEPLE